MCIYPDIYIYTYIYIHIYIYMIYILYIYTHTPLYATIHAPGFFLNDTNRDCITSLVEEDLDAVKSSYDSVASLLARNSRYLHENLRDFEPKDNKKNTRHLGNLWNFGKAGFFPLIDWKGIFESSKTWRNFKRWSDVQWFLRKIFWVIRKSVGSPRGNFEGSILSFGRPADASRSW